MPITPRFDLSQTLSTIVLTIRVPHIRVSASTLELLVDGTDFHFYSPPYLLRLTFPFDLVDNADIGKEARAVFDPSNENGTLTVTVHKDEEGMWKDLDMMGMFQSGRGSGCGGARDVMGSTRDKISVLSSSANAMTAAGRIETKHAEGEGGSESERPCFSNNDLSCALKPHYGFLSSFHSVFVAYGRDGIGEECLELPDPDSTPPEERRTLRLRKEEEKFDVDRYLNDLFLGSDGDDEGDMIYEEAVQMVPFWARSDSVDKMATKASDFEQSSINREIPCRAADGSNVTEKYLSTFFTAEESMQLSTISTAVLSSGRTMDPTQTESLLLGLIDLLFGYAYDHRTTSGDPTVESSWTCSILSPTLSWLEEYNAPYDTPADVLRWCIRRSLIYPYIRSYNLAKLISVDVAKILSSGRRHVLRCLLRLRRLLHESEGRYLLCKLYLDPYIVWTQVGLTDDALRSFASRVKAVLEEGSVNGAVGALGKSYLGLGLVELEETMFGREDESDGDEDDDDDSDSDSSKSDAGSEETNEVGRRDAFVKADAHNGELDGKVLIRQIQSNNKTDMSDITVTATKDRHVQDIPTECQRSSALLDDNIGVSIGLKGLSINDSSKKGKVTESVKKIGMDVQSLTKKPLIEEI